MIPHQEDTHSPNFQCPPSCVSRCARLKVTLLGPDYTHRLYITIDVNLVVAGVAAAICWDDP